MFFQRQMVDSSCFLTLLRLFWNRKNCYSWKLERVLIVKPLINTVSVESQNIVIKRTKIGYISLTLKSEFIFFFFQNNQADLENATEVLSGYLERDISQDSLQDIKQKVQDKYRWDFYSWWIKSSVIAEILYSWLCFCVSQILLGKKLKRAVLIKYRGGI